MMIMLIAGLQAAMTPRAPTAEEIVITAQRIRQVQVEASLNHRTGISRCSITVSSGDPRLDLQICEITKTCAGLGPSNKQLVKQCLLTKEQALINSYVPPNEARPHA